MPITQNLRRASQKFALNALAFAAFALPTALILAAVGSAHAETSSCPLSATKIFAKARTVSPTGGTFATPILPSGDEARFLIDANQTKQQGQLLCAAISWGDDPWKCPADGTACKKMQLLRTFPGTGDESGQTVAVFAVPNGGKDHFERPLFKQAVVQIIGVTGDQGKDVRFSSSAHIPLSGRDYAILAAAGFVAVLYLAAAVVASYARQGYNPSPIQITAGIYGHASLSRLQIFLFSLIVAGLLLYTWLRTGVLLDLSDDLLLLLGISAGGAAGAKYVAVVKKQPNMKVRAYLRRKGWLPADRKSQTEPARARDILLTDDKLNVYKFQAAAFSLVVGVSVVGTWFTGSAGFEIPDSVLALMGLS